MRRLWAGLLLLSFIGLPGAGTGAAPNSFRLSSSRRSVAWTGGPTYAQAAGECRSNSIVSTCDYTNLTVDAPEGWMVAVELRSDSQNDNYDLYVDWRAADGTAYDSMYGYHLTSHERLVFRTRNGRRSLPYNIYVRPVSVTPGATYRVTARLAPSFGLESIPAGDRTALGIVPLGNFPFSNASDLDFSGRYVFAASFGAQGQSGLRAYDTGGQRPRQWASCRATAIRTTSP